MNPNDFLSLCDELLKLQSCYAEANYRTIVGRAYYSSFLLSKVFAINRGHGQLRAYDREGHPAPGAIHSAVRDALFELRHVDIAWQLLTLFENRVRADYKPGEVITRDDADESMRLANRVNSYININM